MTDEQWKQVEDSLNDLYLCSKVKLKIDGYDITLVTDIYKNKVIYAVYINGKIKMAHAIEDCEERRRFFNKHISSLYSARELNKAPEDIREFLKKHNKTVEWYEPYWNSFNRMKSHFIKNNESIELVEIVRF